MTQAEHTDDIVDLQDPIETAPRQSSAPARGGAQAGLLLSAGLVCALFGLAISVAPLFSWKASQIMVGLDFLGVQGGTMFIGGMLMMGLGMLRKGQHSLAAGAAEASGDTELIEEVATDVVQMRHAVDHLQLATSQMQEQVRTLATLCEGLAGQQAQPTPGDTQGDAVFRLAASLDKVGAKIEERMKSQFSTISERLDSVESGFQHAREALESRSAEVAQPDSPVEAPVLEVSQDQPVIEPSAPVEVPASEQTPLGVLDTIEPDQIAAPLPEQAPGAEFAADLNLADVGHAAAAGQADTQSSGGPGAGPWGGPLEPADVEAALSPEERQRQLAETRLRKSLQNMQRDPELGPQGS